MKTGLLLGLVLFLGTAAIAQKKPLDKSVYDGWESIGEKRLSSDGKYLVYTITPQEGDGRLVIRSTVTGTNYAKEIPRGADASITEDGRFAVFHIKPYFKDTREARIRKKTPDQFPKDTLAWVELGTDRIIKIPRVRSYKLTEEGGDQLAYLLEKPQPAAGAHADSIRGAAKPEPGNPSAGESGGKPGARPAGKPDAEPEEGTDLIFRDLSSGEERKFPLVSEYELSKKGNILVIETTRRKGDSTSKALILWVNTAHLQTDTVLRGFNDARNYALDEQGGQLAFVAERDSAVKALVKFYRLWYYTPGMDSAVIRADRGAIADKKFTISTDFVNYFSKDGSRLFLGLAPIRPPKDTTLADFETARLDIWNYKDDYLSPQQLVQLNTELKRSYLAVLPKDASRLVPLGAADCETVIPGPDGEGRYALGMSSRGYRIEQQWEENGLQNIYLVDLLDGSRKLVQEKVRGGAALSPGGRFIVWYDWKGKSWFTYEIAGGKTRNVSAGIKVPLYDELDDHPDDPPSHGSMGWLEGDRGLFLYDRYDIWQCDPTGVAAPVNITRGLGRRRQLTFRYIPLEKEKRNAREDRTFGDEHPIAGTQLILLSLFNRRDMTAGLKLYRLGTSFSFDTASQQTHAESYNGVVKAKNNWTLALLKGSYDKPYDIYVAGSIDTITASNINSGLFSHINPQQDNYNWLSVELHHWKMFDGKMSEGLLYKPENFDSTKKYPVIFYFYERDAETRYQYLAPQPSRSIINIPYFVSNGYIVFDPNIYYKTGQPGEDAYNSVMSAVKYLSKFKWVDTTKLALEGHSWGGYQVAYLVTRTHVFAAAEAGAPVANMTSAYGGIRWGTGISRQFQYEHSQSRIGATLWQRPDLYIKNSPLFRADKITTPLLMMHNDADGSVPWYQGIEFFSALRRLGKKAWLLQYNGEDHGLQERRNRKDWSQRLSQFFGYYLKGEPPARWITDGVPATLKGIDWGLEQE